MIGALVWSGLVWSEQLLMLLIHPLTAQLAAGRTAAGFYYEWSDDRRKKYQLNLQHGTLKTSASLLLALCQTFGLNIKSGLRQSSEHREHL